MRPSSLNGIFQALMALVIVLAVAAVLRLFWRRLLVSGRAPGRLGRWLAESTATPVFLLIVAVGAQVIFARLTRLPQVHHLPVIPYLTALIYVFTVLSVTWVAYGLIKGLCEWYLTRIVPKTESKLDTELIPVFRRVSQVLLIFVALTVILGHYDVKLTALLGVAGIASLAGALAAQDTIANMIAGFTIMIDRPFRLGDRVELPHGRTGDIYEIGLRSTKILSLDHTVHIIPNAELAKSSVVNHSYPNDKLNVRQKLSVAYGNDVALVKRILVEACRAHAAVLADPPPQAFLAELGDAALQVSFNFWIPDHRKRAQILDEINTAIYERFEQEGIQTPFPRSRQTVR